MSGEDAPRPYPEDLSVLEIKTNKQRGDGLERPSPSVSSCSAATSPTAASTALLCALRATSPLKIHHPPHNFFRVHFREVTLSVMRAHTL